jgi:glucose 1-dehydrogenase
MRGLFCFYGHVVNSAVRFEAMQITERVALVTGASRGIGRGCAEALAEAGWSVVINYRTHEDEAKAVAERCRQFGVRAVTAQADVSDREAVDAMFSRTLEYFGRLDLFVANAADSVRKPFIETTVAEIAYTLDVSLWGVIHTAQAATKVMIEENRGGAMVFIGSVHVPFPYGNCAAYNIAKAGGHALAMTLAAELAKYRIRVNVVEPGWVDTPGERKWSSEEEIAEGAAKLPWKRLATLADVGNAVAFLASDKAEYITGSVLRVDGGFTLPRVEYE